MNTQRTIQTVVAHKNVHALSADEQEHVLGGMAYLTDSITEREASIRTVEIFRLEIE